MSTATWADTCGSVVVCFHRGTKFRDPSAAEKADKPEYIIPETRTISFFEPVLLSLHRICTWKILHRFLFVRRLMLIKSLILLDKYEIDHLQSIMAH
jgi:hypothetical protein